MSSSDVARSQRALDKIGARLGLTPEGKQWLTAAIDPFHDTPLDVKGYPDVNEAASVVQVVKASQTFTVPGGVASGANWDMHIHMFPWEFPGNLWGGNYLTSNNGTQSGGSGTFIYGKSINSNVGPVGFGAGYGGLCVDSCAAGANTFTLDPTGTSVNSPFFATLSPYFTGEYRIIAKGFEVINTTSELNVQGLCTVYRQPCAPIDSAKATLVVDATANTGSNPVYSTGVIDLVQTAMPPASTAEALLLDGTKQWKAKEGAYVVPTLSSMELPPGNNTANAIMRLSSLDPSNVAPPSGYGWAHLTGRGGSTLPAPFQFGIPVSSSTFTTTPIGAGAEDFFNYNHGGAYLTGLSYQSAITVNVIYYIERFPSQQDSELVVLARHSCRNDCVALDLYSEIIREMPVGVPQRMNGFGEWFANAVSSAADFVSPVLSAIPHPVAQAAAMGLRTAGGIAKSFTGKKEAAGMTYSATGSNVSSGSKPKMKIVEIVQKKKKKVTKKK